MRRSTWTLAFLASASSGAAEPSAKRPEPGAVAPEFSASATNGKTVKLSEYKGKKTVVLAFFPKVFTGG